MKLSGLVLSALAAVATVPIAGEYAHAQSTETEVVLNATADTWVALGLSDLWAEASMPGHEPHGSEMTLVAGWHDEWRGWSVPVLDFDLSSLPKNAQIQQATLSLHVERSYGGPLPPALPVLDLVALQKPWDELSFDRARLTPFSNDELDATVSQTHGAPGEWIEWDVTADVIRRREASAERGWSGNGWLVHTVSHLPWTLNFGSRESPRPPRLTIAYRQVETPYRVYLPLVVQVRSATRPAVPAFKGPRLAPLPWARPDRPRPKLGDPLSIRLSTERSTYAMGEIPYVQAWITNRRDVASTLILPIDGSDVGWRMPYYTWESLRTDGRDARRNRYGRCGNIGPLRRDSFVSLAPGESVRVDDLSGYTWLGQAAEFRSFAEPGTYEVRLHYGLDRLGGIVADDVADLWADALDAFVSSEPVTITVLPPGSPFNDRYELSREITVGWGYDRVVESMGDPDRQYESSWPELTYYMYDLALPRTRDERQSNPAEGGCFGQYCTPQFAVGVNSDGLVEDAKYLP